MLNLLACWTSVQVLIDLCKGNKRFTLSVSAYNRLWICISPLCRPSHCDLVHRTSLCPGGRKSHIHLPGHRQPAHHGLQVWLMTTLMFAQMAKLKFMRLPWGNTKVRRCHWPCKEASFIKKRRSCATDLMLWRQICIIVSDCKTKKKKEKNLQTEHVKRILSDWF